MADCFERYAHIIDAAVEIGVEVKNIEKRRQQDLSLKPVKG